MIGRCVLCIAMAALPLALMGQGQPPSTSGAANAIAAAEKLYQQQGPRAALPQLERLLAHFQKSGDRASQGVTLGLMANCYRSLSQFPQALEFARHGLAIKQALEDQDGQGRSYNQLGLIHWEMADYPRATVNLQRAIQIGRATGDQILEASAVGNLGLVEDELGDYAASTQHHEQALELDRKIGYKRGESNEVGNLGGVKMLLGQFSEAIPLYQQALKLDRELGRKPSESEDLGNLAECYGAIGKTDEAVATFDRALQLAQDAGLTRDAADWHRGKGDILQQSGRYQAALEEYRQAQLVYEKAGLKRELVDTLNGSGNLHLLLGDVVSGQRDFQRALRLARAIHNEQGVILNLEALGEVQRRQAHFTEATSDFQQAMSLARRTGDLAGESEALVQLARTGIVENRLEPARQYAAQSVAVSGQMQNPPAEAESLLTLGDVQRARHRWADAMTQYDAASTILRTFADPELGWRLGYGRGQALEQLGRLDDAVKEYKLAVALIESVREELGEERYRAGYLQDRYQVYVALVDLLLKLHRPDEAFLYSERLRARSYLDQLSAGGPAPAGLETPAQLALRERIRQLRRAIADKWSEPHPQRQQRALETYSSELGRAERAYEALLEQSQTWSAQPISVPGIPEVQKELQPGSALLEYVIGPSRLDILVVRRHLVQAVSEPVSRRQLESRVELMRYFISRPGTDQWRPPAASLRRLLLEPVERAGWLGGVSKLYISPDGILNDLPFAALPESDRPGSHFLVQDYVLAYVPTAAALRPESDDPPAQGALAMAPERARLRWSQQEARDVANDFPVDSRLLEGRAATETAFKRFASQYDVLHLATHGYLNRYAPLLSSLELEPDSQNDGQLEVYEILQLKLHARLVTLSACQTALGSGYFSEIPAGDEFVGLTRAFLSAGAQAVVATLWNVNDRSTLDFMDRFYRDREKQGNAVALAQAQRAMASSHGPYRYPYYWAPFVLVGR